MHDAKWIHRESNMFFCNYSVTPTCRHQPPKDPFFVGQTIPWIRLPNHERPASCYMWRASQGDYRQVCHVTANRASRCGRSISSIHRLYRCIPVLQMSGSGTNHDFLRWPAPQSSTERKRVRFLRCSKNVLPRTVMCAREVPFGLQATRYARERVRGEEGTMWPP